MRPIEHKPRLGRKEHAAAHGAHDESGAGVIAEGQKPLRLPCGYMALLMHIRYVGSAQRIAPGKAHKKGGGPRSRNTEKLFAQRGEELFQIGREPQTAQQHGDNEKREERGNDQLAAEPQRLPAAGDHLGRGCDEDHHGAQGCDDRELVFQRLYLLVRVRPADGGQVSPWYQSMKRVIDLYGQEVAALKKIGILAADLAERLELPEDALLSAAKLSLTAGRRALVENHKGILEYGTERILISTGRGKISLSGSELRLVAMSKSQLLISGKIQNVEWE